jgi:hypothetical protein
MMDLLEGAGYRPIFVLDPAAWASGSIQSVRPQDGTGDLTVARATDASRVNRAGVIEILPANVPRIQYNASSGLLQGLAARQAITNLQVHSEAIDQWTSATTNTTVTSNVRLSPRGTTTVDRVVCSATGSNFRRRTPEISASVQQYTVQFFTYGSNTGFYQMLVTSQGEAAGVHVSFNHASGDSTSFGSFGGFGVSSVASKGYLGGVREWRVTFTPPAGTTGLRINSPIACTGMGSAAATSGDFVDVWGIMLRTGSGFADYVPTGAAAVTYDADVIGSYAHGLTTGWIYTSDESAGVRTVTVYDGTNATVFQNGAQVSTGAGSMPASFTVPTPSVLRLGAVGTRILTGEQAIALTNIIPIAV